MIAPEIKEKDEEVLEFLDNIEYIPDEANPLKFDLIFTFSENEFFENTVVKKSIEMTSDDEPKKGYGDELEWKEGKNITVKTIKKT
jgi:nucleosome assembly protein 1-like 1